MPSTCLGLTLGERTFLLETLKDLRIVECLNGRKARNNEMPKQGFEKMNKAILTDGTNSSSSIIFPTHTTDRTTSHIKLWGM